MKKIFYLIPIIFLLTGCNSYIELNNLGVINKIGIEHLDNYKLYASIINEVSDNLNLKEKIIIVEGKTIEELINNLSLTLNKKIYMSHLDLLILNNSIKTYEIKELTNYFLNNNDTREDFLVVTTDNIENIINKTSFQEINNLVNINQNETSISIYTTMFDVIKNYTLNKPIYISNLKYNNQIELDGITKIYNNKITHIDNQDSIFINYLLNNIETYKINLECDNHEYLYLNILSSNTNIINNRILITIVIKVINDNCNLDKNNINKLLNNYLKDNLKKYTNKEINIKNTIRSYYDK